MQRVYDDDDYDGSDDGSDGDEEGLGQLSWKIVKGMTSIRMGLFLVRFYSIGYLAG